MARLPSPQNHDVGATFTAAALDFEVEASASACARVTSTGFGTVSPRVDLSRDRSDMFESPRLLDAADADAEAIASEAVVGFASMGLSREKKPQKKLRFS